MSHLNRLAASLVLAGCANLAHAAGFALIEQNASGLGNAYAGQAAAATDASTIFFNPAGMTYLPDRQAVVAGHLIRPKAEFSGTVSSSFPVTGGQGGDAGDLALVPNAYFAFRLTPDVHLGVGLNAPFGLSTEYDPDWVGRTQAIESKIETVNVNPSIAWRISETLSVGAGINLQRIEATLTNQVHPLFNSSHIEIEGDDYGWGFNLGAIWHVSPNSRLGLAYRSEVDYTLEGSATVTNFPLLPSGPVTADVTMPASASLSLFHKLSSRLDLLADVTWTGWSAFDELRIVRTNGDLLGTPTQENWEDILRYSLGATWHMSDKLSLRGGVAYDEAPVSDRYRTPRIPDGARTWIAVGGQYRLSAQSVLDFGYAHLFVNDPGLQSRDNGTTLNGEYSSQVDILSAQITLNF